MLLETLFSLHPFGLIEEEAKRKPGETFCLSGLCGSSKRLCAAFLAQRLHRPLLFITRDEEEAYHAYEDFLIFFEGQGPTLLLEREELPGSRRSGSERMKAFEALIAADGEKSLCLIGSIRAISQGCPPPQLIKSLSLPLQVGQPISMDEVSERLYHMGYEKETIVEEVGKFSIRGGILDVYPITTPYPIRLEFFGDTVDSLRTFDPITQRSEERLEKFMVMPLQEESIEGSLVDYLPPGRMIAFEEPMSVLEEARKEPRALSIIGQIQKELTLLLCQWSQTSEVFPFLHHFSFVTQSTPDLMERKTFWEKFTGWIEEGYSITFFCANRVEAKRVEDLLEEHGLQPTFQESWSGPDGLVVALGRLASGFALPEAKMAFLSASEIFQRQIRPKRFKRRFRGGAPISHFSELKVGDYVVHIIHGIGKFLGIVYLEEHKGEFLLIEYLEGSRLYVPVNQVNLVQKYLGLEGQPPRLNKLGSPAWARTKEKVKRSIQDMASELMKLYAARQSLPGYASSPDTPWQRSFEEAFPYDVTPGQKEAIEEVKRDMELPHPMDRLLCGDVGYGKTEVALRAAFKAVMDGKQVTLLAPTTILVQQHFNTFSERLKPYPVRIETLSRFRTSLENRKVIRELAEGKVDIVIGTHRLLQKDVSFKDLGLLIIDEEHRFGVAHKEAIKKLRSQVDVLALTATPIPRTLYISLMGMRDMSVIDTPPEDRLPICTVVEEFDEELIKRAMEKELSRQGQVFYVHNRIDSIELAASTVKRLIPYARVAIAHGRLESRELEEVMMQFMAGEYDILVSTTIIESGLDIPNVNTIIINRSDRMGLAELYQLRGRVGRYKHRAYAYLLIPRARAITEEARKRLSALEEFSDLGSGFKLAMRDLQIRGAGNILGPEQHGNIIAIGFELYCQLIEETMAELKGQKREAPIFPTVELPVETFIPLDYIPSPVQKLTFYKRIASISQLEDAQELEEELEDRYGTLPESVKNLLEIAKIKFLSVRAGLEFLGKAGKDILFRFSPQRPLDSQRLSYLSSIYGKRLRCELNGSMKLFMPLSFIKPDQGLLEMVKELLIAMTEEEVFFTSAKV